MSWYRRIQPFILNEGAFSPEDPRASIILAAGRSYPSGCVLGKVAETGRHAAYAPGANDGSEVACGILHGAIDASDGERIAVATVRMTEVNAALLHWGEADAAEITQGIASLAVVGIIVRAVPGVAEE